MKLIMCAVHDTKIGAYMTPFFTRSRGEALRSFQDACDDTKSNFHKHAQDYALYVIAEFDDIDASITYTDAKPYRLASAADYVTNTPL